MQPLPKDHREESRPKRPPYRPPIGIPIREEGKTTGAVISILLHVLIIVLLLAPPFLIAREIRVNNEGAGGPGPVGGGGGGTRGTGGENARERLRYMQMAPPPPPAPVQPKIAPKPVPVVPKVEPPKPRLSTGSPGKSSLSVVHMRIVELPTKTIPPGAGGVVRSASSNCSISFANRSRSIDGAADGEATTGDRLAEATGAGARLHAASVKANTTGS